MGIECWLKYNVRNNRFTLHKDSCSMVVLAKSYETYEESRNAGDYVYDGCWTGFLTLSEAIRFHSIHHKKREFKLCRNCFNQEVKLMFKIRGNNNSPQYPL